MDLNSVDMFVRVVQAGSFSGAARSSGIPVATLSRRVSELEKELGVRLLERSTRYLRLNEAGTILFDYAVRGLQELSAARLAIENREKELRGNLRLSVPPNFQPWWPLLQKFQLRYPNVNIEIFVTERKIDLIGDGIDVALRVGDAYHQSSVLRKVTTYRHILVASPAYIKEYGEPQFPEDLLERPCASWNMRSASCVWQLGDSKVEIPAFLQVNDFFHLIYLAVQGQCIIEAPPFLVSKELSSGQLIPVLSAYPCPLLDLNLLYPSRHQLSRIVQVYVNYCLEEFNLTNPLSPISHK